MTRRKIKKPKTKQSGRITIPDVTNYDNRPPIFSLERVQNGDYCFSVLDQADKAQFAEAVFKRRTLTWTQIKKMDRHGLGFEKIAKNSVRAQIPLFIKDDVRQLLAFRFNGLKPMVGYRINNVFYVLWFDHNFTLYDH